MTEVSADHPVVLVGAGKMGGAMLSGWINAGRPAEGFHIVDPAPSADMQDFAKRHGVVLSTAPDGSVKPSVVIIAVKPQMMDAVLPTLAAYAAARPAFVSVAAGTPVATFEAVFGGDAAVVRAMPNTPAQVGRGITIGFANGGVSADQRALVADLLTVTGAFDWVDREELINAVTAVSGSGPAYVFHMVEAMAAAGVTAGLEPALALKLARATVEGAGELLHQSDLGADVLRQNVTSPGGTTAAALAILMAENGLTPLMTDAVAAAKQRADELSG
ncbi:MAG: pyrroline-5-carboxylate reductase [Pseudomonadota bacterium]